MKIKNFVIIGIIVIALTVIWANYYIKNNNYSVIEKVARLIVLPDEVATIAKVTDMTKLQSQKFFKNAVNGDIVLIFPQSSKAILYRERINKIIDVMSQLPKEEKVTPTPTPKQEIVQKAKMVLLNGTTMVGLTNIWEKEIVAKVVDIEIIDKQKATETNYEKTVVVDVTGKYIDKVDELAQIFDAQIVSIPSNETATDADILVILGKNSIK